MDSESLTANLTHQDVTRCSDKDTTLISGEKGIVGKWTESRVVDPPSRSGFPKVGSDTPYVQGMCSPSLSSNSSPERRGPSKSLGRQLHRSFTTDSRVVSSALQDRLQTVDTFTDSVVLTGGINGAGISSLFTGSRTRAKLSVRTTRQGGGTRAVDLEVESSSGFRG